MSHHFVNAMTQEINSYGVVKIREGWWWPNYGMGVYFFLWSRRISFLEGSVNQNTYKTLLDENLIPFIQRNADKSFIFQQNGAPAHKAKNVLKFLDENNVELLDWAAQSPDLNPVKHVWAIMKKSLVITNFLILMH